MYAARWISQYTTPLDTSSLVVINGVIYQTLRMGNDSNHIVLQTLLQVSKYFDFIDVFTDRGRK